MRRREEAEKRRSGNFAFRFTAGLLRANTSLRFLLSFSPLLLVFFAACSELEKPKTEPFYAETAPPPKKEFRWSNGKIPKTFDPAKAAAPPETDIVRAVYEGLTEIDSKNLQPIPAVASDWKASDDLKTWTFNLRKNVKWSNGETVTANDFVRSWKRLAEMKNATAHRELTRNIAGFQLKETAAPPILGTVNIDILPKLPSSDNILLPLPTVSPTPNSANSNSNSAVVLQKSPESNANIAANDSPVEEKQKTIPFGVAAVDDYTLKVSLLKPDKDFPALVAHPIFRPVYADGKEFETDKLNAGIVTNGAFRITSVGQDGITLDRSENYWNRETVELERVKLIPSENAEKALDSYRKGDVDAVTNANFEPLALKLLATYEDFRPTAHAAINFYEFNREKKPFDDKRVREALAIAIERERITQDEMDGASKSAMKFLPFDDKTEPLVQNTEKAKMLLAESGFPDGADFPAIKLLINRNNVQQKIARVVAKMWKKHLNIETEITAKDAGEIEAAWKSGEFDLLRRGVVLPTADETAGMSAIFAPKEEPSNEDKTEPTDKNLPPGGNSNVDIFVSPGETPKTIAESILPTDEDAKTIIEDVTISTEEEAMQEIPAIPLYFSTSYSLVKPYIQGFDINVLDAPLLKNVKIDNNWQPKTPSKK